MLRRPLEPGQYLSIRYTERLADAGIEPSVGSVGDSYDNAMAETVIGLYQTEVIRRRGPWRNLECVEFATLGWVDWFNNRRLLEPIRVRSSSRIRGSLLLEQKDACPDGGSQLTKSPKNPGRLSLHHLHQDPTVLLPRPLPIQTFCPNVAVAFNIEGDPVARGTE